MNIKPSKFVSAVGVILSNISLFIGIFSIVPKFKEFGIVWIILSIIMCIYYGINLLTKKGLSLYTMTEKPEKQKKD